MVLEFVEVYNRDGIRDVFQLLAHLFHTVPFLRVVMVKVMMRAMKMMMTLMMTLIMTMMRKGWQLIALNLEGQVLEDLPEQLRGKLDKLHLLSLLELAPAAAPFLLVLV